jgi:glucose/mannose-6-phosphate isomerase
VDIRDLDDLNALQSADSQGMLDHVGALATQCRDAWAAVEALELPSAHLETIEVIISGMGGSAIGGDLAAAVVEGHSALPIQVLRDYGLPAYADERTLVIASSYSGNTEETLSAFRAARERGCALVAVTTGGELARLAEEWRVPLVAFHYESQPRAALGYSLMSLLGVLHARGLAGDVAAALEEALALLAEQDAQLAPVSPQAENLAKRLAADLAGHVPIVVGAGPLAPVARRWKTQLNENGKAWAHYEPLPEMDHNALSGIEFPAGAADGLRVLFLESGGMHPRNRLRVDFTAQILGKHRVTCHRVPVPGRSSLAQILAAVQMGDYTSVYLALLYSTDPTEIGAIVSLKHKLAEA